MNIFDSYDKWLVDEAKSLQPIFAPDLSFDEFMATCCFVVTVNYKSHLVRKTSDLKNLASTNPKIQWVDFDTVYQGAADVLVAKSLTRCQLPFVVAATDQGSKFAGIGPMGGNNIHIHSLWFVPAGDVQSIEKYFRTLSYNHSIRKTHIGDVKAEKFDPARVKSSLFTYVIKAWIKAYQSPSTESLRIYRSTVEEFKRRQYSYSKIQIINNLVILRKQLAKEIAKEEEDLKQLTGSDL